MSFLNAKKSNSNCNSNVKYKTICIFLFHHGTVLTFFHLPGILTDDSINFITVSIYYQNDCRKKIINKFIRLTIAPPPPPNIWNFFQTTFMTTCTLSSTVHVFGVY